MMSASQTLSRPKVVIVGAGFGGLAAAKRLANQPVDVTVIDKRNYHLFQPLLYQVATADLSPADVAWPIRGIFAHVPNVRVVLGKVEDINLKSREVISDRIRLPYDYLILATGSYHSYFGHDEWAMHAPGLKRIIDATEIRKRILLAFELAEVGMSEEERRRQLTFVIIGGGPTGVEMAGAIAELARYTLASDFRNINPRSARIILVEAGERLLRAFPERLSDYAKRRLEKLGVEVLLNHRVEVRGEEGAFIGDMLIPSASMIWAAGVTVPHLMGLAPCRNGPDRPRQGGTRPVGAPAPEYFRDRRCRAGALARRLAGARHRTGGQAGWPLCGGCHSRRLERKEKARAIPLPPPGQSRHHRPPRGHRRFWRVSLTGNLAWWLWVSLTFIF